MFSFLICTGAEVDGFMLTAMLHSGQQHTPVLVVSATSKTTAAAAVLSPVAVADQLQLCKLANHPWQVCCTVVSQALHVQLGLFCNR